MDQFFWHLSLLFFFLFAFDVCACTYSKWTIFSVVAFLFVSQPMQFDVCGAYIWISVAKRRKGGNGNKILILPLTFCSFEIIAWSDANKGAQAVLLRKSFLWFQYLKRKGSETLKVQIKHTSTQKHKKWKHRHAYIRYHFFCFEFHFSLFHVALFVQSWNFQQIICTYR